MRKIEPMLNRDGETWSAIWKGLRCKCPKCGRGELFHHYIEQVDRCSTCGEPLSAYRVGLFLPLVLITLMVHVIAFVMLEIELSGYGNPKLYLYVLMPLSVIVPLVILPSSKGAIIGLMWAKGWSDEQEG